MKDSLASFEVFQRDEIRRAKRNMVISIVQGIINVDDKPMPTEIAKWGVIYPPDQFSRQSILDRIANDGRSGFEREEPKHWPKLIQDT